MIANGIAVPAVRMAPVSIPTRSSVRTGDAS